MMFYIGWQDSSVCYPTYKAVSSERCAVNAWPTYLRYYEHSRTHLSWEKDTPVSRAVQLPELCRVIKLLPVSVIFAGVVAAAWLTPI